MANTLQGELRALEQVVAAQTSILASLSAWLLLEALTRRVAEQEPDSEDAHAVRDFIRTTLREVKRSPEPMAALAAALRACDEEARRRGFHLLPEDVL